MKRGVEMNTNLCHCITITDCLVAWWVVARIGVGQNCNQVTQVRINWQQERQQWAGQNYNVWLVNGYLFLTKKKEIYDFH